MVIYDEEWLSLTKEDAIDPELPICDPHHHFWDVPDRCYLLEDFHKDIGGGHNIVKTVFIESESVNKKYTSQGLSPVEETKLVHDIANQNVNEQYRSIDIAAGIISFADLTLGNAVKPVIEEHIAASDRFRGIRHTVSWSEYKDVVMSPSPPGLLLDPKFREGLACLKDYDLVFETFLYHPQMMELEDLAMAFPDIPMILDHIGGIIRIGPYADKQDEVLQEWKSSIKALAACPNVFVKLGGLGMSFSGFGWEERPAPPDSTEMAKTMAPYYLWCIEEFGVERCMFESNFPVEKASCSYTVLWNAFKRISEGFSPAERDALFYRTAVKVYRL